MEIAIYFIKTKEIKSKKKNAEYFLVQYLVVENLEFKEQFISKDLYENIKDYEPLGDYIAVFELNNNLRATLVDIK